MVLSNEPGYYKTGAFGIRIENLVEVVVAPAAPGVEPEKPMLGFATLTLAPVDRNLVETALLDAAEIGWVEG